jgi:hypothetical protein
MSDRQFERAVHDWLEDGSDRTPPAAMQAALLAVKTTPQQRDLWVPRRLSPMTNSLRIAAAIAIVAIVGVGALAITSRPPGVGGETPHPTSAATGTPSPTGTSAPITTPTPTPLASGIAAWTTYASRVYGLRFGYPADWHTESAATRRWQASDGFLGGNAPFADVFASPSGDDQIGLWVWQVTPGSGADITTREGLIAWVMANACDDGIDACDTVPDVAVPMCVGGAACHPAVLVPLSDGTSAFLGGSVGPTDGAITIVSLGRPDDFPGAAKYGGSIQLLKSILSTMDVVPAAP